MRLDLSSTKTDTSVEYNPSRIRFKRRSRERGYLKDPRSDTSVDPLFIPVSCTTTTERRPVKFRDELSSPKPTRNRPELRRMDEVIERLWDVDSRRVVNDDRQLLDDYRLNTAQSQTLGNPKFADTRNRAMRIRDETLLGESEVQNLNNTEGLEIQQNRRNGQDGVILRSCSSTSLRSKQKSHFLGNTVLSKCAESMVSFKRGTRWLTHRKIKEDPRSLKRGCFLCSKSTFQSIKHSIEEANSTPPPGVDQSLQSSGLTTVLLTSSPLFGNPIPSSARKSPLDSFYCASHESLNIAATRNPTNELSSDDDDVLAIWDDSDSDSNPLFTNNRASERLSDLSSIRSWEPPVLKSDLEYEVYQLEATRGVQTVGSYRSMDSWSSCDDSTVDNECA